MESEESSFKDNSDEEDFEEIPRDKGFLNAIKKHQKGIDNHELFKKLDKFDRKLIRGIMRGSGPIVMLWLINKKGQHGYEIMTQLHDASPFSEKVKMPSASIIYPKLHQLEKKGLIKGTWEHHGKRKVKYYEITEKGTETLTRIREFFNIRRNHLYEEFLEDILSIKKD